MNDFKEKTMKTTPIWMTMLATACVVCVPTTVKALPILAVVASAVPAASVAHAEAGEQVKDDLFAGTEKFAQGASDVTEVNLDKNMLGMVGKGKDADMAHKLDFIVVHTYTYDKPGMYKMEDVEVFRKRLNDGSWNCSIHTRDKSGSTDICSRSIQNGESSEMVVMTAEPKELTFVHMKGRGVSLSDLSELNKAKRPTPPAPPARGAEPAPPAPPLIPRQ